jgi:hypothetical protein
MDERFEVSAMATFFDYGERPVKHRPPLSRQLGATRE